MKHIARLFITISLFKFNLCEKPLKGSDNELSLTSPSEYFSCDNEYNLNDEKELPEKNPNEVNKVPWIEIIRTNFYNPEFIEKRILVNPEDKKLNLSEFDLTEIPKKVLSTMKNLEELDLSYNECLTMPKSFGVLKKSLKKLVLKGCRITNDELKKICNAFDYLEELDVSEIPNLRFTKKIGKAASTLKKLNISKTNFNFEKLKKLRFKNLEELQMDNNDLSDILKGKNFPQSFENLKKLSVSSCKLSYVGLEAITKLHLTHLDASHNTFYKTEYNDLNKTKNFLRNNYQSFKNNWRQTLSVALRFYGGSMTSKDYNLNWLSKSEIDKTFKMGNLNKSLVSLSLKFCILDEKALEIVIRNLEKLEKLDIYGNLLENIDSSFKFHNLNETLHELNAGWCNLTDLSLNALSNFQNLKKLYLDSNDFSDLGKNKIKWRKLSKTISTLDMSFCDLNENGFEYLSKCLKKLTKLNVASNEFKKPISLGKNWKKSLVELSMYDCKLKPPFFTEIMKLSNIQYLDIQKNTLDLFQQTVIPESMKKSLKILKLDSNNLSNNSFDLTKLKDFALEELYIRDIDLTSPTEIDFGCMKNSLQKLEIFECNVDNNFFISLSKLENLKELKLHQVRCSHISEKLLSRYPLKNLNVFNTAGCNFSLEAIEQIKKWRCQCYLLRNN